MKVVNVVIDGSGAIPERLPKIFLLKERIFPEQVVAISVCRENLQNAPDGDSSRIVIAKGSSSRRSGIGKIDEVLSEIRPSLPRVPLESRSSIHAHLCISSQGRNAVN